MTKLEELENELERLKNEIEKLKEEGKQEKKSTRWKPTEKNCHYCYIETCGDVSKCGKWDGEYTDFGRYRIGNLFKTKEEAEFEAERLKVIAEMKEFAFEPDWNDVSQLKFCIYYNYRIEAIKIDYYYTDKYVDIYFESAEKAQECINAVGADRIKKYYFRVEE